MFQILKKMDATTFYYKLLHNSEQYSLDWLF